MITAAGEYAAIVAKRVSDAETRGVIQHASLFGVAGNA